MFVEQLKIWLHVQPVIGGIARSMIYTNARQNRKLQSRPIIENGDRQDSGIWFPSSSR
jgi:general stress protein 26